MLPIAFATSVVRGLRRTLAEITGAVDNVEAGPPVEEECPVQKHGNVESGQTSNDEAAGLPFDTKMVADPVKEELMFMCKLQVYHEVPVSYLDKAGLKAIGTRWVHTRVALRIHSSEPDWLRKQPRE